MIDMGEPHTPRGLCSAEAPGDPNRSRYPWNRTPASSEAPFGPSQRTGEADHPGPVETRAQRTPAHQMGVWLNDHVVARCDPRTGYVMGIYLNPRSAARDVHGRSKAIVAAVIQNRPYRGYRWLLYYPPANPSQDGLDNVNPRDLEVMSELGLARMMQDRVDSAFSKSESLPEAQKHKCCFSQGEQ